MHTSEVENGEGKCRQLAVLSVGLGIDAKETWNELCNRD